MTSPASRPWWTKKRWAAAGLLALILGYPASAGPACYLYGRGVVPGQPEDLYMPLCYFGPFYAYADWCYELGRRHAAQTDDMPNGKNHSGSKDIAPPSVSCPHGRDRSA